MSLNRVSQLASGHLASTKIGKSLDVAIFARPAWSAVVNHELQCKVLFTVCHFLFKKVIALQFF